MKLPLLIGVATTSIVHTAVKVAPHYSGPVVHVLDASRSVPVAGKLIGQSTRELFEADIKAEYTELAIQHAARQADKVILPWGEANANKLKLDWETYTPVTPTQLGITVFDDVDLNEIRGFIDWTPFFSTW